MKDQRLVQRWMDIHDEIVQTYHVGATHPQLCAALILLAAIIQER
jgi:hypothetical protein